MRSIGIDIGRYSIKVVEIFASNRTYEITNHKEYVIINHKSTDQEIEILQALKQISEEFDTDSARVICSVRQQYISTRKIFFPFRERVKIHKSLAFEMEDDIPIAVEKAVFDSKVIRYKENNAEVVAMACVSEEIESMIDLFNRGHIDPEIISPELSALANLYENWQFSVDNFTALQGSEIDKLLVHIGHSKSFIGVLSNGRVIWGRSIIWGVEQVAQKIAQSFQVPYPTALDMMPEKAFLLMSSEGANKDQIKMSETVAQALAPLLQACRLTTLLVNSEFGTQVQQVDLLGNASQLKNLAAYFNLELEMPCQITNPIENLVHFNIRDRFQLNERFQLAVGLAIEGLKRPFNPALNFRQLDFAKKNQSFEKLWYKWGYTSKVLATIYILFCIYSFSLDFVSTQLEEVSNDVLVEQAGKIANLKGGSATQSKIRAFVRENNNKAKMVEVLGDLDNLNSPIKLINDVGQIFPLNKVDKSYEIRRFFINNDQIDIQGLAKDQNTIESLQKALRALALSGKVELVPAKIQKEDNRILFAFNFKVKRKN